VLFIPGVNVIALGFISGFISSGGDLKQGLISALSAGAFAGFGGSDFAANIGKVGRSVAHGAIGGLSSVAGGGSFKSGFISAAFTKGLGESGAFKSIGVKLPSEVEGDFKALDYAKNAVAGGVGSELGGGKFRNGAITGAFSRLFNTVKSDLDAQKAGKAALNKLREIDEFLKLEDRVRQRLGKLEYKFGLYNGGSKIGPKGVLKIDFADISKPVPVNLLGINMEDYVDINAPDSMYWEQVDRFENLSLELSVNRVIVHELQHGAMGTFNHLINDHHKIIPATNDFMSRHFGELPRDPNDDSGL